MSFGFTASRVAGSVRSPGVQGAVHNALFLMHYMNFLLYYYASYILR